LGGGGFSTYTHVGRLRGDLGCLPRALELYTAIAKGIAAIGYDSSRGPEVAATHGVCAESWREAFSGWNGRIKSSPEVAGRFNALYTGRA
jgi:hypothetical protein